MDLPEGLLGCVDHDRRVIWIATGQTQAERRCTVAHEIGHLERGPAPADDTLVDAEERAIDDWASRQLIPICQLVRAFQWSQHLDEIAEELWVDLRMLRARLRGLTDEEQDRVMAALRKGAGSTAVAGAVGVLWALATHVALFQPAALAALA